MAKKVMRVLRYTAVFEPCGEGGFTVTVPKLPGLVTEGDSFEEALNMVKDAIKGYLKLLNSQGEAAPEPDERTIIAPVDINWTGPVFAGV